MVALFMSANTLFIQQRFNKYFETNYVNYVKRGRRGWVPLLSFKRVALNSKEVLWRVCPSLRPLIQWQELHMWAGYNDMACIDMWQAWDSQSTCPKVNTSIHWNFKRIWVDVSGCLVGRTTLVIHDLELVLMWDPPANFLPQRQYCTRVMVR